MPLTKGYTRGSKNRLVIVAEQRVVGTRAVGGPGLKAQALIAGRIIVPKGVLATVGPNPQRGQQPRKTHDATGLVGPVRSLPQRLVEDHGCEQHAAVLQAAVPIGIDEDAAAWRPAVARRAVGPARLGGAPEAGPPSVALRAPHPAAGYIRAAVIGRRRQAGLRWVLRRRLEVRHLLGPLRRPEARHPAPAAIGLGPVARHPLATGGRHAP